MEVIAGVVVLLAIISFVTGGFGGTKVLKVSTFASGDASLPGLIRKQSAERVLIRCDSPAGRAQAFLTNTRFIIHTRTWLGSASSSSFIPIETVSNAQIGQSNPWGILVLAVISLIGGLVSQDPNGIAGGIIAAGILVVVWWWLMGAALIIQNNKATYRIMSKSESGLADILGALDTLRLRNAEASSQQSPISPAPDTDGSGPAIVQVLP